VRWRHGLQMMPRTSRSRGPTWGHVLAKGVQRKRGRGLPLRIIGDHPNVEVTRFVPA
jgi:hypothetical protein